ncbi:sensor domain-containing diguanylate cyclase [Acidihalobacter prosperus]|uniref:Diguanylate cyclase n=1 Tax=Acidihalobacter prosperus TaxID=160660 RepID=A0A1A6C542_9GAMM|nr:GGDEF domain-containing protein [Acidihalobacter prosperus]OBS09669.1 hypothetical protein Thpro_021997 [Acidihalobacter prosperus]
MQDEEPRLADITTHLRDVVFRTHRNGYWCYLSPAWAHMTGYTVVESLGTHLLDIVHPEDRPMNLKVKQSLEIGKTSASRHVKRMVRKDGRVIHVEVDVRMAEGDEDEGRVSVGTIRDITERVEMEARIDAERQRHESILAALCEGVASLSTDGRIRYLNPAAREMTGWEAGQCVGDMLAIDEPLNGANGLRGLLTALSAGQPYRLPQPIQLAVGSRWLELRLAPLAPAPGEDGGVLVIRDVSGEQELLARLRHQAEHDALTGLTNRRAMHDILPHSHDQATRTGKPYALLICDLDHFKSVNDRHGHAVGDHVLQTVALRLKHLMRPGDRLARWGGEEFLCLLPATEPAAAWSIATRLCHEIATHAWGDTLDGGAPTLSIGMACWPQDLSDPEKLMLCADDALYQAKRSGRNRVWRISPGHPAQGA